MLILPNLFLTLEFRPSQFYYFPSSFFFIFLLPHNFYYFPSSILIFRLLHNFIIFPPPPPPPCLFYIFSIHNYVDLMLTLHRSYMDPNSTLDSTFFQHSFVHSETIYNHQHISIFFPSPPLPPHFYFFPSSSSLVFTFGLLGLILASMAFSRENNRN